MVINHLQVLGMILQVLSQIVNSSWLVKTADVRRWRVDKHDNPTKNLGSWESKVPPRTPPKATPPQ